MTYMPGPMHGEVDAKFIHMAENWINSNHAKDDPTPFNRTNAFFPFKTHRNLPHTRMYWEAEYDHQDVVGLRQHGAKLMYRSSYTRLFLGATISKSDDLDSPFKAAIVLWGKDNKDGTVLVLDAVSFGTEDPSEETKQYWSKHHANRLPVVEDRRRPAHTGATPVKLVSPTPDEWSLRVPFTGRVYKILSGKRDADGDYDILWTL